jgi:hypothetical protein
MAKPEKRAPDALDAKLNQALFGVQIWVKVFRLFKRGRELREIFSGESMTNDRRQRVAEIQVRNQFA